MFIEALLNEWSYFPSLFVTYFSSPAIWGVTLLGAFMGYVIGVLPGLGATLGMALMLSVLHKIPPEYGIALMMSILTAALHAGGITAILINIPGTPAAAATCLDG